MSPTCRDHSRQLHKASTDAFCKLRISKLIAGAVESWLDKDAYSPFPQVTTVDVVQADLVHPLFHRLQQAVDILVFNPPYVPTPDEEVARGGIAAAWAGGDRGRIVIDRVLPMVHKLLSRGGHFFMVTVPENDPQEILSMLATHGLHGSIVLTRRADEELLHVLHVIRV
ncbi:TPA: hypothetical protein ACH3X1_005874 [Trebouxia sp. C0004]